MALGIVGLVIYVIFLIWAWATAPPGTHTVPANGNAVVLAGSLITMLEIHNFLAENIIKHHNKANYQGILKKAFLMGTAFYIFSTMGSFGTFLKTQPL